MAVCLDDPSQAVRCLALEVLVRYGGSSAAALSQGLDVNQPLPIRVAAASALARLGPDATPAMDSLCRSVYHEDPMLRWHAGFALAKIGPAAVPVLRPLLQSDDPPVVATAVDALERIGPEAKEAQEDIQQLAVGSDIAAVTVGLRYGVDEYHWRSCRRQTCGRQCLGPGGRGARRNLYPAAW